MKYAIRLKDDQKLGEWSGLYLTDSSKKCPSGLVDITPRTFDTFDLAKTFFDSMMFNSNWEIVEFIEE